MKIQLQQLLPADISNETALHLVQFVRGLSLALESIYFNQMLLHTTECEYNPFPEAADQKEGDPF